MNPENRLPFDKNLMEPIKYELFELRKDPGKIIRQISGFRQNTENLIKDIKEHQAYLEELRTGYDIKMPGVSFVVGETEKDVRKIFLIADKVEGINLNKKIKIDEQEAGRISSRAEEIIVSLTKYLKDKVEQGSDFMSDVFRADQYMLGKLPGDKQDDIYLLDLETFVARNYGQEDENPQYGLRVDLCAGELASFICIMEDKCGVKFLNARQELAGLVEYFRSLEIRFGFDVEEMLKQLD